MRPMKTEGQRLVALLGEDLATGVAWDASEKAVLGLIEAAADRVAALRTLYATEMGRDEIVAHKVCEISAEIRNSENVIAKLIAALDPRMETRAVSVKHRDAALKRWHPGGA